MEFNQPLDDISFESDYDKQIVPLISVNKFAFFCVLTFGMYGAWWIYKSWKFFKEKDNLDIMPVARAIFAIFFTHALFEKILDYARLNGYQKTYSSTGLFIGFILINFSGRLPEPFSLISLFSFLFLIQPFEALNYAINNAEDYRGEVQNSLSSRQIALVVFGALFWMLVIIGLFLPY